MKKYKEKLKVNVHEIVYEINDKHFPEFKQIRDLEDNRKKFFTEDYLREEEYHKSMARNCHSIYKEREFWMKDLFENCKFVKFNRFSLFNWDKESHLTFSKETNLTKKEESTLLKYMKKQFKKYYEIKEMSFDLRETKAYIYAKDNNKIKLFEKWLYGQYFCQLPENVSDGKTIIKKEEGIYTCQFTYLLEKKETEKLLLVWINDDLLEILKKGN